MPYRGSAPRGCRPVPPSSELSRAPRASRPPYRTIATAPAAPAPLRGRDCPHTTWAQRARSEAALMPPSSSPGGSQGSWGKSPAGSAARKAFSRIKYGEEDLSRFVVRTPPSGRRRVSARFGIRRADEDAHEKRPRRCCCRTSRSRSRNWLTAKRLASQCPITSFAKSGPSTASCSSAPAFQGQRCPPLRRSLLGRRGPRSLPATTCKWLTTSPRR